MPALYFLGLRAELQSSEDSWRVLPPNSSPNDRYWKAGELTVVRAGARWTLACKPTSLLLDKLQILLSIRNLELENIGGDFRPATALNSGAVSIRFGTSGGERATRIGPAMLDDTNATIGFDVADPNAFGMYKSDFGFATGSLSDKDHAVWIGLAANARMSIDLKGKRFIFPANSVEGRLSSAYPSGPIAIARFKNKELFEVPFSESVSGSDRLFELALQPGQVAPLNVDPTTGKPSIELLSGQLSVLLKKNKQRGALITRAELSAQKGGRCEFRLNALRNSRNRAEHWTTDQGIALAFRPPRAGQWHSPLIAPLAAKAAPRRLSRAGGTAPANSEALPLHSWFGASRFDLPVGAAAVLMCSEAAATPTTASVAWLDPKLQRHTTRPWLQFESGVFEHMRPGDAWRGSNHLWRFKSESTGGAAPLASRGAWLDGAGSSPKKGSPLFAANEEINAAFRTMRLVEATSQHETGLLDRTGAADAPAGAPFINEVVPNGDLATGQIRLDRHERQFALATPQLPSQEVVAASAPLMRLPVILPKGETMEFAVAWPALEGSPNKYPWVWISGLADWARTVSGVLDPDAPIAIADLIKDLNFRPKDFPLGLLKVTRARTLADLLKELGRDLKGSAAISFEKKRVAAIKTIERVDPTVLDASWVGMVMFDIALDFEAFPMLKAVMPSDPVTAPRFAFVSIVPRDPSDGTNEVAMSASVEWENETANSSQPKSPEQEATFWPRSLRIEFRDRKLTQFRSEAELTFNSFLGLKGISPKKNDPIKIIGSAQRTSGGKQGDGHFFLRFAAEVQNGGRIPIFPVGDPSESSKTFIKTIWFRRVEIVDAPDGNARRAEIDIDGSIEFQKPDYDFGDSNFFKKLSELAVDFTKLRIELSDFDLKGQLLKIKYPSLRFNVDFPHMALLGSALKLKFNQLIVDWGSANGGGFDFGQFPSLNLPSTGNLIPSLPKIILRGRIDFGALPDLFARSLSGFSLDSIFALNLDTNGVPKGLPYVGIGGFGFDSLNLDLASFIRLKIDRLTLGPAPWDPPLTGSALTFKNASLDILDLKVLEQGHGAFFSSNAESGNGFWTAFLGVDLGLLALEWGFVGNNIDFPQELPVELLTPPPAQTSDENFPNIAKELHAAWSNKLIKPANGSAARGWTFAAGLSAFEGAFRGRALFQDGGFMGLALYGEALKKLLGWNFVFVGLYRKNITPGEDYFYFSVTLPPMTFGGIRYTGGAIAAEIFTSGDFTFDFGFPWRSPSGGRQWERTIGAIVTPGQASGGFYVRKRRTNHPDTGAKKLKVGGGVAFQWGLGTAIDGGVFKVWVRIGLYAIVEGEVVLQYKSTSDVRVVAFMLQGAVGVLAEGEGQIEWWVISVRVGVRASAEIRASLIWDSEIDDRVLMPIEAELSVSAYAEACIGGGCARLCRGISVNLHIPVRYQLQFG